MQGEQRFNRFQFENQSPIHEHVGTSRSNDLIQISYFHHNLPLKCQGLSVQLERECILVSCFRKTRPDCSMYIDTSTNDLSCQRFQWGIYLGGPGS